MTSTYDQPTWQLMLTALDDLPDTFEIRDMLRWFGDRYPKLNTMTVRIHIRSLSVNVPAAYNERWPDERRVLYKLDRSRYTRYRPEVHGLFEGGSLVGADDEDDDEASEETAEDTRFRLEAHLEEFMEANWSSIDFGAPLQIWTDGEGMSGRQYETDVGRIDFLCTDTASGDFVVVELKRGRTSDRVVGQVQRYMGWVQEHLANGRGVRGLIITHEYDEGMRYALKMTPEVDARTYRVNFELMSTEQP